MVNQLRGARRISSQPMVMLTTVPTSAVKMPNQARITGDKWMCASDSRNCARSPAAMSLSATAWRYESGAPYAPAMLIITAADSHATAGQSLCKRAGHRGTVPARARKVTMCQPRCWKVRRPAASGRPPCQFRSNERGALRCKSTSLRRRGTCHRPRADTRCRRAGSSRQSSGLG